MMSGTGTIENSFFFFGAKIQNSIPSFSFFHFNPLSFKFYQLSPPLPFH